MEVTLRSLSKRFGAVVAVDRLDLTIPSGDFVALLGPSGCGKTTTLYMMAGIYRPTAGEVYFGDRLVTDLKPQDRRIGMVFQSYALYPHMTVYENIAFPLSLKRTPRAEMDQRVRRVAAMVQIEHLLDRKPGQLSGGQQQRVALSRALVKEPDLLLLDEPLSNLDAKLRMEMRGEIKRLQQELKLTTILVTHDQVEAMTMADRIALMNEGRLEAYDRPLALYKEPPTRFVAGFIGSLPMNFLEVEWNGAGELSASGLRLGARVLPASLQAPMQTGRYLLGFRPEDAVIAASGGDLVAKLEVVEPLGREVLYQSRIGGAVIRALGGEMPGLAPGRMVGLRLHWESAHLFDPQSGRRIGKPAAITAGVQPARSASEQAQQRQEPRGS